MQTFTAWQYLLIDATNQFGLDKLLFEERIQWTLDHLQELESLADKADTKPLYLKAVQAIRKAQKGIPTGHLVGFDACCSGIQVMSAITGCVAGATATGLVDPNVRADAYSTTTQVMNEILHAEGIQVDVPRKDAKAALMTSFYGSRKRPKEIFGEDTPELAAFYKAAQIVAPGAWDLLQDLLASWQSYALFHAWKLPDGFDARIKVMTQKEVRIEVDELDHATFTYEFYENQGIPRGHMDSKANAANVVHSLDGFALREIHRRCNYDPLVLHFAHEALVQELELREQGITDQVSLEQENKLNYYIAQYERSGMPSAVILPYILSGEETMYLSTQHLKDLIRICERMKGHKPFAVVSVH